jgi:hypothetical protein
MSVRLRPSAPQFLSNIITVKLPQYQNYYITDALHSGQNAYAASDKFPFIYLTDKR